MMGHCLDPHEYDIKATEEANIAAETQKEADIEVAKNRNYHLLPQEKKLFVGGLPIGISEEEFQGYFSGFGNITDCVIIHDKQTRKARGFGFVSYDSVQAVNAVLHNRFHTLKGKPVDVKRAQPKTDNLNNNNICYYVSPPYNNYNNFNNYYHPNPYPSPYPYQTYYTHQF